MDEKNEEILKRLYRNRVFKIKYQIQDLQEEFEIIFGKEWSVSDKLCLFERQLQVSNLEAQNLINCVCRIT